MVIPGVSVVIQDATSINNDVQRHPASVTACSDRVLSEGRRDCKRRLAAGEASAGVSAT